MVDLCCSMHERAIECQTLDAQVDASRISAAHDVVKWVDLVRRIGGRTQVVLGPSVLFVLYYLLLHRTLAFSTTAPGNLPPDFDFRL